MDYLISILGFIIIWLPPIYYQRKLKYIEFQIKEELTTSNYLGEEEVMVKGLLSGPLFEKKESALYSNRIARNMYLIISILLTTLLVYIGWG